MKLPKFWTTVTPLSKTIALILFAFLPAIAFFFGVRYQQRLDQPLLQKASPLPSIEANKDTTLPYMNPIYHFSFRYPADLTITEDSEHTFVAFDTAPTSNESIFSVNVVKTQLTPMQWWEQVGSNKNKQLFNRAINPVALSASSTKNYSEIKGIEVIGQKRTAGGYVYAASVTIYKAKNFLLVFTSNDSVTESQILSSFKLE